MARSDYIHSGNAWFESIATLLASRRSSSLFEISLRLDILRAHYAKCGILPGLSSRVETKLNRNLSTRLGSFEGPNTIACKIQCCKSEIFSHLASRRGLILCSFP